MSGCRCKCWTYLPLVPMKQTWRISVNLISFEPSQNKTKNKNNPIYNSWDILHLCVPITCNQAGHWWYQTIKKTLCRIQIMTAKKVFLNTHLMFMNVVIWLWNSEIYASLHAQFTSVLISTLHLCRCMLDNLTASLLSCHLSHTCLEIAWHQVVLWFLGQKTSNSTWSCDGLIW